MLLTILDFLSSKKNELPMYNDDINNSNKYISPLKYNVDTNNYIAYNPSLGELIIDNYGQCITNPNIKTTFINNFNEVLIEY